MLPLVVFPFLHMLNLDVHCEPLGHKLNLIAESFDQHAGVALKLIKPLIDRNKTPIDRIESCVEPLFLPVKALSDTLKTLFQVLNKFLIHTVSAVGKSMPLDHPCQ